MSRSLDRASASASSDQDAQLHEENRRAAAQQIAFFRSIPWCAAHLDTARSPSLVVEQAESRRLTRTEADTLISRTLNAPGAVPAYVTFYDAGEAGDGPSSEASRDEPPPPPPSSGTAQRPLLREVGSLVALGPMVNGWEGVCHGGLVVTLLDEVMGLVFAANKRLGRLAGSTPIMTGYLNTRFERPVRTGTAERPAVVLITARLVRHEGRKYWMEGDVQDEGGVVLARAEALFLQLREKL